MKKKAQKSKSKFTTNKNGQGKGKKYTVEELLELGCKTNKIEIAPDIITPKRGGRRYITSPTSSPSEELTGKLRVWDKTDD